QINSAKAEEMFILSKSRGNERAGEVLKRIEAAKAKKAAVQNL
ncbi:12359_t:CDS:1, partial [Ambispora gerdemannii]